MIHYTYFIDKHNGEGLKKLNTKPIQGNSDVKILNEELDNGFMSLILKNKEPLPIMSYIVYEIYDGNHKLKREFCISNDDVTRNSKNKNYYTHNIELIELTKILEKQYSGTLCFTPSIERGETRYYLSDCIDRILKVFEPVTDLIGIDVYNNLNNEITNSLLNIRYKLINSDLHKLLSSIPAPQFVFNNPTLREALDGVLKYVNAVARLEINRELNMESQIYYENTLNTKFQININDVNDKVVINIRAKKNNDNFCLFWGDGKEESSYQIKSLKENNYYKFEKNFNNVGSYIISMPSDNSYEFIGDKNLLTPSCYIQKYNSEKETLIPYTIDGLESIGEYAFYSENTKYVNNIKLLPSLKNIGNYAFFNCVFEEELHFPSTLEEIGEYAFNTNTLSVGSNYFFNSVNPPKTYNNSFSSNRKLTTYKTFYENYFNSASFPKPIYSYSSNTELIIKVDKDATNLKLRPHIRIIPQETTDNFIVYWNKDYNNYESYSVEEGKEFFLRPSEGYSDGIYTIVIPKENKYYFESHLDNLDNSVSPFWKYCKEIEENEGESDYTYYVHLIETNINNQDTIYENTFKYCDFLETVNMSNDIHTIEQNSFYWCTSLNKINISQNVSIIQPNTFYNCTSLKEINLHGAIKEFKNNSFLFSGLEKIVIHSKTVKIETNAFYIEKVNQIFIPNDIEIIQENSFYFNHNPIIYIGSSSIPNNWNENWTNTNIVVLLNNQFLYLPIINADFLCKKKNKLYLLNKIYKDNTSQNIEQYSTNTISFVKNITSEEKYENFNIIQYPKIYNFANLHKHLSNEDKLNTIFYNDLLSNFARLKSKDNDYNITDSNYGILTQNNIQSVINVQIPAKIEYDGTFIQLKNEDLENPILGLEAQIVIDITDNVIEEEEYNNLDNKEKNNYFYYKKYSNFIDFGGSHKEIFFTTHSIENVIAKSLERYINKYSLGKPFNNVNNKTTIILTPEEELNLATEFTIEWSYDEESSKYYIQKSSLTSINNVTKTSYRVSYIPILNTLVSSEKQNSENCYLESEILVNQEERVISFSNFINTTFSVTQRNGNINKEVVCKHSSLIDLINVGDYTNDNYICTKAEYIYYNNYIIGKYSFDKDYNRISTFMGINSENRQYEIPNNNDSYERNILLKSYCFVSYKNDKSKNTLISNSLSRYMLLTLGLINIFNDDKNNNKPLKFAFVFYNYNFDENKLLKKYFDELNITENGFLLECFTSGASNTINFNFGFNNNISGGSIIKQDDILFDTSYKLLKQQVPYVYPYNEDNKMLSGCLRNISFEISDGNDVLFKQDNLPLARKDTNYFLGSIRFSDLLVLKDPAEILKFTYQLHFLSKDDRITLGNAFFENNYIHKNEIDFSYTKNESKENRKFYLYASKSIYDKFDLTILKEKKQNLKLLSIYHNGSKQDIKPILTEYVEYGSSDFYIKFNKSILEPIITSDTKTIILADEYDNIIIHIAYDPNDVDENGENYLYKPIYFNFKDRRSDIKYEY